VFVSYPDEQIVDVLSVFPAVKECRHYMCTAERLQTRTRAIDNVLVVLTCAVHLA